MDFEQAFWMRRSMEDYMRKACEEQEAARLHACWAVIWIEQGRFEHAALCQSLAAADARNAARLVDFVLRCKLELAEYDAKEAAREARA